MTDDSTECRSVLQPTVFDGASADHLQNLAERTAQILREMCDLRREATFSQAADSDSIQEVLSPRRFGTQNDCLSRTGERDLSKGAARRPPKSAGIARTHPADTSPRNQARSLVGTTWGSAPPADRQSFPRAIGPRSRVGVDRLTQPRTGGMCAEEPCTPRRLESSEAFLAAGSQPAESPDGEQILEVGSHTLAGRKDANPNWENQDRLLVLELPNHQVLVAVFDGHGEAGHQLAELACEHFQRLAPTLLAPNAHAGPGAILRLFSQCQSMLENDARSYTAGTTAVVALIDTVARTVTVAHTGDSRAALGDRSRVLFETEDHKWDPESEARVNNRGGEIRDEQGCRRIFARGDVWPGLAMSRSLGDVAGNQLGVTAEPEISQTLVFGAQGDSALVLGSDGLWGMVPADFALNRALSTDGVETIAQSLVTEARLRWPAGTDVDDITAVVVRMVSARDS